MGICKSTSILHIFEFYYRNLNIILSVHNIADGNILEMFLTNPNRWYNSTFTVLPPTALYVDDPWIVPITGTDDRCL